MNAKRRPLSTSLVSRIPLPTPPEHEESTTAHRGGRRRRQRRKAVASAWRAATQSADRPASPRPASQRNRSPSERPARAGQVDGADRHLVESAGAPWPSSALAARASGRHRVGVVLLFPGGMRIPLEDGSAIERRSCFSSGGGGGAVCVSANFGTQWVGARPIACRLAGFAGRRHDAFFGVVHMRWGCARCRWRLGGLLSYTEHHAFFSAPAAPVGTVGEGPLVMHSAYTEQITRKLSAAAFVRRGLGRLPAKTRSRRPGSC